MDRNFNIFAISNKQAHIIGVIISGNLTELRYDELDFSLTEQLTPTSVLLSRKRVSNYITDHQYFSLLILAESLRPLTAIQPFTIFQSSSN